MASNGSNAISFFKGPGPLLKVMILCFTYSIKLGKKYNNNYNFFVLNFYYYNDAGWGD